MNRHQRRRMRRMARHVVGDRVLDVGCAQLPNPFLTGRHVVGLDLDPMPLAPPYTRHVVGNALDLPALLPDECFDTILLGALIEHVENPYELLRVLHGSLAEGGRAIVCTPNPFGIPMLAAELLHSRRFFYTPHHLHAISPRWMWRMLERSGFRVLKTLGNGACLHGLWCPAPVILSYTVTYVAERA